MKLKRKTKKISLGLALQRRWVKSRPGSVLILVIALLVLLALLGTAFLSSTQTERYSSQQNSVNVEADLLMQGMQAAVTSKIAAGLYGSAGTVYRQPQQEEPSYPGGTRTPAGATTPPPLSGYFHYDSAVVDPNLSNAVYGVNNPNAIPPDLFLADRLPIFPPASGIGGEPSVPMWNTISWPLFPTSNGNYNFDSPFDASINTYLATNKGKIQAIPSFRSINGQLYPALQLYTPTGFNDDNGNPVAAIGYIGGTFGTPILAASASGDGIADAALVKIPVGQINGITYYYAMRVVDGNSALNASSAYTQGNDVTAGTANPNPVTNYGMFAANIGMQELLNPLTGVSETANLNNHRFGAFSTIPVADTSSIPSGAPTNFTWYSQGEEMESQLTRRPGNPGLTSTSTRCIWFGQTATAALAYRYSLVNPNTNPQYDTTSLEYYLYQDLVKSPVSPFPTYQSAPWSPAQATAWWNANFAGLNYYASNNVTAGTPLATNTVMGTNGGAGVSPSPVRTVLVGNNAVSNAVPTQLGFSSAAHPLLWTVGTKYKFGDWVTDSPATTPPQYRSFVCLCDHTASNTGLTNNEPADGKTNVGAVGLWAGAQTPTPQVSNLPVGVPWRYVPVKASINTAPFDQLYLNFCQLMTDSNSPDQVTSGPPHWQPPFQSAAAGTERQMRMFRSTLRNKTTVASTLLSSAQMLRLRGALAAINTLDMRDSDDDVTSARIILNDDAGAPQYEAEVYGIEAQPFIGQVFVHMDRVDTTQNFMAVQLLNPYDKPITINPNFWKFCSIDRSAFPNLTLTDLSIGAPPTLTVQVPARSAIGPGILVIASSNSASAVPAGYTAGSATTLVLKNLVNAIGKEFIILKPRIFTSFSSSRYSSLAAGSPTNYFGDYYNEASNLSDLVPVDQVDTTGMDTAIQGTTSNFYYRRGSDPVKAPWNFVYAGQYTSGRIPAPQMFTAASTAAALADFGLYTCSTAVEDEQSTYPTIPLVVNNTNMAGPNYPSGSNTLTPIQYPFGGFARNGDILQIPFVGSYRIRPYSSLTLTNNSFTEMNSISMDSSMAGNNGLTGDTNPAPQPVTQVLNTPVTNTFAEQLGRFCPVGDPVNKTFDFNEDPVTGPSGWHYHWAKKIFDYFTVNAPSDDYYPNSDPAGETSTAYSPTRPAKYPGLTSLPVAIANNNNGGIMNALSPQVNKQENSEDNAGVEGRININTAPVVVIAQLPFTAADSTFATPAAKLQQNAVIAQAIVSDRTVHGPFKTIFDLYRVQAFRDENNSLVTSGVIAATPGSQPGTAQGIFSPNGLDTTATTGDGVRNDFKEHFLLLNNISNLITTRSDTFTVYLLVQGWRNVGTSNPTLAVERRSAFIVDRNGVAPSNPVPTSFKVPN